MAPRDDEGDPKAGDVLICGIAGIVELGGKGGKVAMLQRFGGGLVHDGPDDKSLSLEHGVGPG